MKNAVRRFLSRLFVLTGMMCAISSPPEAKAEKISEGTQIPVLSKYKAPASEEDDKARGISGMTCLGEANDASRECLVINDEETFGEVALLTKDGLKPTGKQLNFTTKGESGAGILGAVRVPSCGDTAKFGELDGEGVAAANGYIYVISSHSCSGGGKYKPSSYLLVRFKPENLTTFSAGTPPTVERSWRVADMLLGSDPELKKAYGGKKEVGTNIEGVAVAGERLYAGLRTPLTNGDTAFIVSAPVNDLFAPGPEGLKSNVIEKRTLTLGKDTGIRDLAALDNGGLLVLSGPTIEQAEVGYKIWHVPPPVITSKQQELVTIKTAAKPKGKDKTAKAESITIIEQTGAKVVLIINYDNVDEGAPSRHEIDINPQQ